MAKLAGFLAVVALLVVNIQVSAAPPADNSCISPISGFTVSHCPEGWVKYQGTKCFKLFSTAGKFFEDARTSCQSLKSELASIHSDDELEFLKSYALRELGPENWAYTWIGGKQIGKFYFWLDLSPFDYNNWYSGYPNAEPCLRLATAKHNFELGQGFFGKMFTSPCNEAGPYICQKLQANERKVVYSY